MTARMQKVSSNLEAVQEQHMAEMASRLRDSEDRWSQSLDTERLMRERKITDVMELIARQPVGDESALSMEQGSALSHFTEFAAETIRDLTTRMDALRTQADAAAAGIAGRKAEAVTTIERLQAESLQNLQQAPAAGGNPLSLPRAAMEAIEAGLSEVMEQQLQKLTTTISGAVEKQVADVSGQLRQAEERWAGAFDKERQERRDTIIAVFRELEVNAASTSTKAEPVFGELDNLRREVSQDLDAKFEVLRQQTEVALSGVADSREDLTAMIRSATAELCGGLTQQQQQQQEFRRLRQELQEEHQQKGQTGDRASINGVQMQLDELRQTLDRWVLKQTLPQQPEMTPQAPTPQAFETVHELAQGLRETKEDLETVEKQLQGQLESVEKHFLEAIEEIVKRMDEPGSVQDLNLKVQAFSVELQGVQRGVIQTGLQAEEKHGQLQAQLKRLEERGKSLEELRGQCAQLNSAAVESTSNAKLQNGKLAFCLHAVERLQQKCQCLPEPSENFPSGQEQVGISSVPRR